MILFAIEPSPFPDLSRWVVDLSIPVLNPRQPLPNVFLAVRVRISTFSLLLTIHVSPFIAPSVLPSCQSMPVQLTLLPTSIVLHSLTFIVTLAIKFVILPESFIRAAILVHYTTKALFGVVFEVALVLVFLA